MILLHDYPPMDSENQNVEQRVAFLTEENHRLREELQTLMLRLALMDCYTPDDVKQSISPNIGKLLWPES